jgi:lipid-A-disaccharide synthase
MKYYIIAGEASGDLHGSNLLKEIRKIDQGAVFRCWGGDKMQEAGGTLVKHYRDLAFMGFSEVIKHLPAILRNLKFCKEDILNFQPDALLLIDYPGFNLRIAEWAKKQSLFSNKAKVIFYISPQVWAWKENRVKALKRDVDRMLVILPFEKEYFSRKWQWDVDFVGHPLVEEIERFLVTKKESIRLSEMKKNSDGIIALLPGSRKQEILKKLPVMLEASKSFPTYRFVVAGAPSVEEDFYKPLIKNYPNAAIVFNKTYELLSEAKAALVTSGTATLETALFGVPEIVCYKSSWLSYQLGKRLIRVKYISLVNLIMDKPVVRELIQQDLTAGNLEKELNLLLHNKERQLELSNDYSLLKEMLAKEGNASAKAASLVFATLTE